jgi:hypothetical protein
MFIFRVLGKLRFIKKLQETETKLDRELTSFSEGAGVLMKERPIVLGLIFAQILQFTFIFESLILYSLL